ncbi:MAG: hypothetical protein ACLQVD_08390 [Capsulimonadaceae bacterium]
MPTATVELEGRISALENRVNAIEQQGVVGHSEAPSDENDGWLGFLGVFADSPDFDEAVQLGKEWRYKDHPEGSPGA